MRAKDKRARVSGRSDEPDYWDFMYFAFVLGMTFQVSDVQITRARVRRVALAHGILAFFFDVFILALSVNVVAGKVLNASSGQFVVPLTIVRVQPPTQTSSLSMRIRIDASWPISRPWLTR